jgi:hypothetical protein
MTEIGLLKTGYKLWNSRVRVKRPLFDSFWAAYRAIRFTPRPYAQATLLRGAAAIPAAKMPVITNFQ